MTLGDQIDESLIPTTALVLTLLSALALTLLSALVLTLLFALVLTLLFALVLPMPFALVLVVEAGFDPLARLQSTEEREGWSQPSSPSHFQEKDEEDCCHL